MQIYRNKQVFGSARLTDIAARLRVPCEVLEPIVGGIVHKLDASPSFAGRPDRVAVEAALERIAHRMLVQREWDRAG